jgi:hypothetical protein
MMARRRRFGFVALVIFASLSCLSVFALAAANLRQSAGQYPNVLRPGHLSGVRLTVTGLGRCLTVDQHFFSGDRPTVIRDWYVRRGWTQFVPFVYQQQVGPLGLGRFYTIDGGRRETMVLTRQVYCLALN